MATKRKPRKTAKKRTNTSVVLIGKRKPARRRKSVGATSQTAKKRKKRGMGSTTGIVSNGKKILWYAVGLATGAVITEVVLRPIEAKLTDKWPKIGKWIAAGEIFLGGMIALKGKSAFTKSVGVGILAGGVTGAMRQFNVTKYLPSLGDSEFSTIHIPISGPTDQILAGLLQDRTQPVRTSIVAGMAGLPRTETVSGSSDEYGYQIAGQEWESAWDAPMAKGL